MRRPNSCRRKKLNLKKYSMARKQANVFLVIKPRTETLSNVPLN